MGRNHLTKLSENGKKKVITEDRGISCEHLNWIEQSFPNVKWRAFVMLVMSFLGSIERKRSKAYIVVTTAPNTCRKPLSSCLSTKHASSLAFPGLTYRWMKAGKWFSRPDYRTTLEVPNRVFRKQKHDRKEAQQNTNSLKSDWSSWRVAFLFKPHTFVTGIFVWQ